MTWPDGTGRPPSRPPSPQSAAGSPSEPWSGTETHHVSPSRSPVPPGERGTLGSLCAIDHQPREWTERDCTVLKDLAAATVTEIELRRTTKQAVDLAAQLERALHGGKP